MLDGLSKGVESLGVPQRAAWSLIPGITSGQLQDWESLKDDEVADMKLNGIDPVTASRREAAPAKPASTKPVTATNGTK
jgi:hypothetical protein